VKTSEIVEHFLNHYRNRGTTFLLNRHPGPGGTTDKVIYVHHPTGPDIAITPRLFADRVRGYLEDSATPATAQESETITAAVLARLSARET
jgi:hypothetical protein